MAVVLNCGLANKQPTVRKKTGCYKVALICARSMEVEMEAFSEDRNGLTKLPLDRFIHGDQFLITMNKLLFSKPASAGFGNEV
jgi:hypothetical protein